METIPLDRGRQYLSSSGRIITQEEYEAIMSEVSNMGTGFEDDEPARQIEARVRKLEFYLLMLVGFVLIFFMISRTG